jgi:hypothetical protein
MHSDQEDDGEDNDFQEGDEPSAAKMPRVVCSVELHRRFVAAVNQLGIDSENCQPSLLLYVIVLTYCSNPILFCTLFFCCCRSCTKKNS